MTITKDKLRGGYYTPAEVARFLCDWAITSPRATVLEPSCGNGAISSCAVERLMSLGASKAETDAQVIGVELFEEEASKAALLGGKIIAGDFFSFCKQGGEFHGPFDAIVGNPPFIRYQDFAEEYRESAFELMRSYGFKPNRLTNIWLPFLVVCCHLLSDEGRLAMVIPAELFQVKYAAETRSFLMEHFQQINVITFKKLIFDGIQQEVVLLLAEKTADDQGGIRVIEATDASSLASLTSKSISDMPTKRKLPGKMKWQGYYLSEDALDLLQEVKGLSGITQSSALFDINVGLVSGQNSYFLQNKDNARTRQIEQSCVGIISRSFQLNGLSLTNADFDRQIELQRNVLLFLPTEDGLTSADVQYIKQGEEQGINKNFKCRVRKPWWRVPTSWKPDAFFYRQVGSYPRIVLNEAEVHTTDTLHKVRFADGIDGKSVAVAFNNSYTFLWSELLGRSYGGGVLTFEPSEARELPVPYNVSIQWDFEKADTLAREGKIEALLDYVDRKLLIEGLGLTQNDATELRRAWHTLRDRRLSRKTS
ncbi:MAG: class I SAM-dependent methyltransferase [Parolsenella sp.]|uniref:class I SAM-dependent methyltransferase n=1 Tax=Parolsenella sp. TaxID=2083006 RepID=UPI002E765F8D|nr:class I SAM-dependent methyltransferase [Parolsenella sp.]MEE1372164.1 class I SAM-dependent methyltransferase [Parolsenella sp.]